MAFINEVEPLLATFSCFPEVGLRLIGNEFQNVYNCL